VLPDRWHTLCEHTFVSIKDSSYANFKRALDTENLAIIRGAAAELATINLEDALRVALLVCEHEPERAERAVLRWLGRWALEAPDASLARLLEATVALSALAHAPERWEGVLRGLASGSPLGGSAFRTDAPACGPS
jgi:hypothetical protein